MLRLETFVLLLCLGTERIQSFQPSSQVQGIPTRTVSGHQTRRYVASSFRDQSYSDESRNRAELQAAMSNITASYLESMSMETTAEEQAIQQRLDRRAASSQKQKQTGDVIVAQFQLSSPIGIFVSQVKPGRKMLDIELNLDALRVERVSAAETKGLALQRMDWPTMAGRLDSNFNGVLVSSVVQGSAAWDLGVRAGDVLTSVSATLGDALWPTSTLDGIQSALRSRKMTSQSISMEFRRITAVTEQAGNRFELTLQRPLGIEVKETEDGFVVVTGFSDSAPNLVRHAIQVGDRVTAVDSSFGETMWPVTTVAGLASACTSRLPGAPVTLQLERPLENMLSYVDYKDLVERSTPVAVPKAGVSTAVKSVVATAAQQQSENKDLLERCRNVLERYSSKSSDLGAAGFKNKYAVPAIVADKVVDALASAEARLDGVTLSMVMRAYLSCDRADSALRVFEAAVGLRADATCFPTSEGLIVSNGGSFTPNESALNIYTGTALLQAHAMKGDLYSVSRVLASLEGRSGVLVNGLESAPWPFTGEYGSIQPDTKCYNIAISAAASIGGEESLEMALALFDSMAYTEKLSKETRKPEKNVVTYNTMISALSNAGRSVDAFRILDRMKMSKMRPDKFTYTPLVKACLSDVDIEELLYDMRENNVKGDTVTYNTLIRSLCEKRRWTEASRLVTEMEGKGVTPDSRTYGTLMAAMLKAGKPTACLTLFESACASSKTSSLTENVHLYTTAITAASVMGDCDRAIELLSRMSAKGVKPNMKTLTSVVGASIAAKEFGVAAQVYRKIENPDAYAMCQGIEALSGSGAVSEAYEVLQTQKSRQNRVMTGKQIMKSFQTILVAAVKARDFGMAELVFTDLMQRGHIPNKAMLQEMSDALGYNEVRGMVSFAFEDDEDKLPTFRFMLFVLDSLRKRNLPVESYIYSVTLFLGRLIGGKARTIASLISRSKVSNGEQQLITAGPDPTSPERHVDVVRWVDLLENFEKYDMTALESTAALPVVSVRVGAQDIRRLVRSEREVDVLASRKSKGSRNTPPKRRTVLKANAVQ